MTAILAPIALAASTGALLALPLTPALRELISKRDAGPLVTRKDDGRIDNFARSLRERYSKLRFAGGSEDSMGQQLLVVSPGTWTAPLKVDRLVVCDGALQLPGGLHCLDDFYAQGAVHSGNENLFRALLSDAEIVLGAGTQVMRWVHSEATFTAREHCRLFGRASAAKSIALSRGCLFERMHAPEIFTSTSGIDFEIRTESAAFSKLAQAGFSRRRVQGRARVSAQEEHYGDIVATSALRIDDGASIFGSVKANGQLVVGSNTVIDGGVVSTKRIHIASGCYVKGPVIAEREIVLEAGSQIGLPHTPTTVSAPRIHLFPGSVLFGTVWARTEGRVEG